MIHITHYSFFYGCWIFWFMEQRLKKKTTFDSNLSRTETRVLNLTSPSVRVSLQTSACLIRRCIICIFKHPVKITEFFQDDICQNFTCWVYECEAWRRAVQPLFCEWRKVRTCPRFIPTLCEALPLFICSAPHQALVHQIFKAVEISLEVLNEGVTA